MLKGIDWNLEGYKKEAHFFLCGAFESFDFICQLQVERFESFLTYSVTTALQLGPALRPEREQILSLCQLCGSGSGNS